MNNVHPRQLFLGNIAYKATESDIRIALEGLGITVATVRMGVDRVTGRSRGFAFVDLDDNEPLPTDELIQTVNGLMICGRPCRADAANKPKADTKPAAAPLPPPPRVMEKRPRKHVVEAPPSTKVGRFRARKSDFERPWHDDD